MLVPSWFHDYPGSSWVLPFVSLRATHRIDAYYLPLTILHPEQDGLVYTLPFSLRFCSHTRRTYAYTHFLTRVYARAAATYAFCTCALTARCRYYQ